MNNALSTESVVSIPMTPRPTSVSAAIALQAAASLVGAVSASLNIASAPTSQSRPVMIIAALLIFAILALLLYLLYVGNMWARIVFAIGTAYALVTGYKGPNPLGVHHPFVILNYWLQYAVDIIALLLLFLPSSNQWYRSKSNHG